MKKVSSDLKNDVNELVEKVTVEEAHMAVLQKLETALSALESPGQELLRDYLEGCSLEMISQNHQLSLEETQQCVEHMKRQLISQLQRTIRTRH